ncbi:MAG: DNA-formamidopyrimidine glycosylase family protein [Candidatus Bipolaricaulota bacterium]
MPELPELEILREALARRILGWTLCDAAVLRPGILKTLVPPVDALKGTSVRSVQRRGKHLILACGEDLYLAVHLMLSGRLVLARRDTRRTQATAFCIGFENGQELRLVETGSVKRARVHIVRDLRDVEGIETTGPEPLSDAFTPELLASHLGERRQIKKALTDPSVVAGIGSVYADEILHAARLSPIRYASTLEADEILQLHAAIQRVLREATERTRTRAGGDFVADSRREGLSVVGRTGHPCPVCGTPIAEIRFAERRTYYCPTCQSRGKTLADRRAWLTR